MYTGKANSGQIPIDREIDSKTLLDSIESTKQVEEKMIRHLVAWIKQQKEEKTVSNRLGLFRGNDGRYLHLEKCSIQPDISGCDTWPLRISIMSSQLFISLSFVCLLFYMTFLSQEGNK